MKRTLALTLVGLLLLQPPVAESSPKAWPETAVLVADRPDGERYDGVSFMVLDPASLDVYARTGNVKSAANTILAPTDWALSADGSTLAALESAWNVDAQRFDRFLVVRHGVVGNERGRFPLPEALGSPRLSADGTRLIASALNEQGEPGVGVFVIDTRDGRVLSRTAELDLGQFMNWLDPGARRVVRFELTDPNLRSVPWVSLADIETGAVLGRLAVGDGISEAPAVALSPDARRLAVLEPTTERLTVVDLEQLSVERSFVLREEPSAVQTLLETLGILPRVAHAKPQHGAAYQMLFTPDGERVYVFGSEAISPGTEGFRLRGLGVRLVDLQRESVVATGLSERPVSRMLSTADGGFLYAWGPAALEPDGYRPNMEFVLHRLDPRTLEVLRAREFTGSRHVLLWPAAYEG